MLADDAADIRASRKRKPHWQFNIERDYERSTKRHVPAAAILLWSAAYPLLTNRPLQPIGWTIVAVTLLLTLVFIYRAPVLLGMKTGFPLYILGTSTFGTAGSYFVPGLLLGIIPLGWLAFIASLTTRLIFSTLDVKSYWPIIVMTFIWGYTMLYIGSKGLHFISRLSLFLSFFTTLLVLAVLFNLRSSHVEWLSRIPTSSTWLFLMGAAGFCFTIAAAGMDFGLNNANEPPSGSVSIATAGLYILVLPVLFAIVLLQLVPNPAIEDGTLRISALLFFSLVCVPAACLSVLIVGNGLSIMLPSLRRESTLFIGVTVAMLMAVSNLARNYNAFFTLIGASLGSMAGAIVADFLQSGKKWKGPKSGFNIPGCAAWLFGFIAGIIPLFVQSESVRAAVQPAVFYSFLTGFLIYMVLAKRNLASPSILPDTKNP